MHLWTKPERIITAESLNGLLLVLNHQYNDPDVRLNVGETLNSRWSGEISAKLRTFFKNDHFKIFSLHIKSDHQKQILLEATILPPVWNVLQGLLTLCSSLRLSQRGETHSRHSSSDVTLHFSNMHSKNQTLTYKEHTESPQKYTSKKKIK